MTTGIQRRSTGLLLSATPLFLLINASAAMAETCASEPVTVRGEQARYEWLAKTKARANWRARVRATPGLGPDFANWPRARDTLERCLRGPSGVVCIFTGTPCRT